MYAALTRGQTASSVSEAFTELLTVYETLGEELPLVQQYEKLFLGTIQT